MMCHFPDLGHASDCLCWVVNLLQLIRNTIEIWVLMRHQYGISAFTLILDVIAWGNQSFRCKMSAVFPVYF